MSDINIAKKRIEKLKTNIAIYENKEKEIKKKFDIKSVSDAQKQSDALSKQIEKKENELEKLEEKINKKLEEFENE